MAEKAKPNASTDATDTEALPTVEEHAEALRVEPWILAGLRVRMGWAVGTRVSRAAFERALEAFLQGPTA